MPSPLLLLHGPGVWTDARSAVDVAAVRDTGLPQWPGVPGASDVAGGGRIRAARQLLRADRRPAARARDDAGVGDAQVGTRLERPGQAGEPAARAARRSFSARLLLEHPRERVRHR